MSIRARRNYRWDVLVMWKKKLYISFKKNNNQDFICVNNFNYLQLKIWLEIEEKYTKLSTEHSILIVRNFGKREKCSIFDVLSDWFFEFVAKCRYQGATAQNIQFWPYWVFELSESKSRLWQKCSPTSYLQNELSLISLA